MAIKQNVQFVLPALSFDGKISAEWWQGVKFAIEQVLPQLLSNVNELVDGKLRLLQMQALAAAPTDVKTGWIAYADGSNWNPGAGEGAYEYRSDAAWHKL